VKLKQKVLLFIAMVLIVNFVLIIIWGDKGLIDFYRLETEKKRFIQQNEKLTAENQTLYREIDRLKHDLKFVESVARQELGMIRENEIIFKFKTSPDLELKDNDK
jgi:cell division protein FtsB